MLRAVAVSLQKMAVTNNLYAKNLRWLQSNQFKMINIQCNINIGEYFYY